jgi:predicted ribosome quality control (RQC) complex YloA/Tae2 family protein
MRKIIEVKEEDVARRFESPDGMIVLVGKSAEDNDVLTFKVAAQNDFWLHVAGESGSHVVVRNPENLETLPRETLRYAASLAARYSKAKNANKATVHVSRRKDVQKPRGMPAGKVLLKRYKSVKVEPHEEA